MQNINLIVVAGPSASGGTSLDVDLDLLFPGAIISADSRQVFAYALRHRQGSQPIISESH